MIQFHCQNGTEFQPGATIQIQAVWNFDKIPKSLTARLVWVTEGKGTQDSETAIEETWIPENNQGSRSFHWIAPRCPITHVGTLLRIHWQLEIESVSPNEHAESSIAIRTTVHSRLSLRE